MSTPTDPPPDVPREPSDQSLRDIVIENVVRVLTECGGSRRAAARRLKVSRTTVHRVLKGTGAYDRGENHRGNYRRKSG